jgi:nuclear pore complex protein Nup205
VNGVILSRGQENDQTILQTRNFLNQNKQTMVAVFKRHARVGGIKLENDLDLNDLVDNFTLLVTVTGYIEVSNVVKAWRHSWCRG